MIMTGTSYIILLLVSTGYGLVECDCVRKSDVLKRKENCHKRWEKLHLP